MNVLSPHTKNRSLQSSYSVSLAFLLSGCMHAIYSLHLEPNLGVLKNNRLTTLLKTQFPLCRHNYFFKTKRIFLKGTACNKPPTWLVKCFYYCIKIIGRYFCATRRLLELFSSYAIATQAQGVGTSRLNPCTESRFVLSLYLQPNNPD